MRVLVTGSTSMIGHHVVDRLVGRGDEVTVGQRRPGRRSDVREVLGDLADPTVAAAATTDVDAVIHLAAKVGVTGAWSSFQSANIDATRHLLDNARRHGARRFVHVSTPSVAHGGQPLSGAGADPADPERAGGHYARSKAIGEQLALGANGDGLSVVALRPHLVIGPGDTQLVQRVVDRARAGRLALVGSGLALIDVTWVDNAADAIVAALDRVDHVAGEALVVSNGEPRTVAEVIGRILQAADVEATLPRVPARLARIAGAGVETLWEQLDRSDDPPMTRFLAEQLSTAHWFDQRVTRRLLEWSPRIDLDEGFDRLATYFRTLRKSE